VEVSDLNAQLDTRISDLIKSEPVFLFMKGNPTFPQCGFSNQVVQILKAFDIPFGHFDVLTDMDIRQGIKEYSDWPTIPQLYISGEFIGGCDIVREGWESGELGDWLRNAFPDKEIKGPQPPARPRNITPAEAKDMLGKEGYLFLDVRTPEEREKASVEGFELLDQSKAQKILEEGDRDTPLVFICHFGGRSTQACEYFAQQGFQHIYNVQGGIDAWSQTVDENIPRY
jgi:monothiol glutaredoxin